MSNARTPKLRLFLSVSRHSQLVTRHLFLTAALLLLSAPCAFSLDPSLDVSQYAHTAWKVRDGFPKGVIYAMTQTPDGYLWLGTEFGLYRFDGVRAVPWQPPPSEQLSGSRIHDLLLARDGTLWISTIKGLASWKDGKLTEYPELAGQMLGGLLQDRAGTVWVGAFQPGRLCAIQGGQVQCYGAEIFGAGVWTLYESHNGSLWVCSSTGLWRWDSGRPDHYPPAGGEIRQVMEDNSGKLLVATSNGLKQLVGGRIQPYPLAGAPRKFSSVALFRSSDGSLWIGTRQGLLHSHQGRTDVFVAADGLSGDGVARFFEDREGSVWVSTSDGLDRFREMAFPRISTHQGLSSSEAYSIQATANGTVWIGTSNGLNQWRSGHVTVYGQQTALGRVGGAAVQRSGRGLPTTPQSLGLDDQGRLLVSTRDGIFYFDGDRFIRVPGAPGGNIWSIAADGRGKLWVSDGYTGLSYFAPGEAVEPIPWSRFGQKGFGARALLPDRPQGGVWVGFFERGISYFKDGQVRASYAPAAPRGNGRVNDLRFGPRGALWAATDGGLSRIEDGSIQTLAGKNGLPCDEVHWSIEDDDHFVWLYQPCGLVRIARSELDAWGSDPNRSVQSMVFDTYDGVRTVAVFGGYGPHVTKAPDGKIWFVTYDGVSVIDPRHLPHNDVPPPVHIEQITADGKVYDAANGVQLPRLARYVDIDYTALSLVVPEKVRFRVKLEGEDKDWRELVNVRRVSYTNLGPKHYRFLVKACNNSGVWNEEGAALDFVIPPAWYQTNWFRVLCVAAFLVLLWVLYQLRLRQLAHRFNMRLEERVGERTRIARDLHDTLLQSFHGILLFLQSGIHLLDEHPAEAKKTLKTAAEQAERAILEGREAVQGLRASTVERNDLALAIKTLGGELAGADSNEHGPEFAVQVEGVPRDLHPILRDEVYRIVGEAMRNAFRHSDAKQIEVEIRYDERRVRVRVRDDGKGIDPELLSDDGREGHFGLRGMRERAKLIGGKLTVWSELDSGTEVELNLPANRGYTAPGDGQRSWLAEKFAKLSGKDTELKS